MNLIINDTDHPLIIKVASVPAAKMQVYFIDNEEYFKRKAVLKNQDDKFFDDNDERSIFFCRGVLEAVKKLGWKPDVIHCNGFMTAMMPLYLKKMYGDDPHFTDTKVVYSIYEEGFDGTLDKDLVKKLKFDGFEDSDIELMKNPDIDALNKLAINLSDGVVAGSENLDQAILDYAKDSGATFMEYQGESCNVEAYSEFYDTVIDTNSVLAD
jgi:starch synthase